MASRSHHWQGRSATSLAPDLLRRRRVFRLRFRSQVRWPHVAAGRSISTVQPPLRPCRGRPIRGVRDPHGHRLRRPDLLGKPTWWLPRSAGPGAAYLETDGKPLSTARPRHGHHRRSMPTAQGEPVGRPRAGTRQGSTAEPTVQNRVFWVRYLVSPGQFANARIRRSGTGVTPEVAVFQSRSAVDAAGRTGQQPTGRCGTCSSPGPPGLPGDHRSTQKGVRDGISGSVGSIPREVALITDRP
jgi:hypothetical protein